MVAPVVVVARLTMTAPFCAPLLVDVVTVGAAATVGVGVGFGEEPELPPLPQPQTNEAAKSTPVNMPTPIRIFEISFFATEQALLAPKEE
jgi:hypothetical protein